MLPHKEKATLKKFATFIVKKCEIRCEELCLSRLTFKKSNVTPVQLNAHWQKQDPFLHCFDAHSNSSFCCSFFAHPSASFILYPNTFCFVTSLLPSLLCNNIFRQGWRHLKARVVLGPPWPNFFFFKIYIII